MEKPALVGGRPVRETMLPYARHTVDAADVAAVTAVLGGDWLTMGPAVGRFEAALATRCGARHAVAVSNGTSAVFAACWAAELSAGDEVVTTPLTFVATANAIVSRGARPVLADIDATTLNLNPDSVSRALTPRTRAVIAVDFAGLPCDYAALGRLPREEPWRLIADAAHSLGAAVGDRPVGALAEMTTFSFHPAKAITAGEGGAVLTDDPRLAERLRRSRHHGLAFGPEGLPWVYDVEEPGHNYRLTDLQSALLLSQLTRLDERRALREKLALRYRQRLLDSRFADLPALPAGVTHGWHIFVALLRLDRLRVDGDTILRALRAENIGVHRHYPLLSRLAFYRDRFGWGRGLCPVAESIEPRLVTLPLFPTMTEADQDDVLRAIDKVCTYYAR